MAGPDSPVKAICEAQQQFAHPSRWKFLSIKEANRPFNNQAQGWCKFSSASLTGPGLALNKDHIVVPNGTNASTLHAFAWDSIDESSPRIVKLSGSKGTATDLQFNNFVPSVLACGSQNGTISMWNVNPAAPENNLSVLSTITSNAGSKVLQIAWNPMVLNCLASSGSNGEIKLHDIEQKNSQRSVKISGGTATSISWANTGDLLGFIRKKTWGLVDIRAERSAVLCNESHPGAKPNYICMTGSGQGPNMAVTSGFDKEAYRELKLWDLRSPAQELDKLTIDRNVGSLFLHYDLSSQLMFSLAKGDSHGQGFDISGGKLWRLNGPAHGSYAFPGPVRYFGFLDRRFVDTSIGEQQRIGTVVEVDGAVELRYSRFLRDTRETRTREFVAFDAVDYPVCVGGKPLYTFPEWLKSSGPANIKSALVSMDPSEPNNCYATPPEVLKTALNLGMQYDGVSSPTLKKNIETKMAVNNQEVERIEKLVKDKNTIAKKQSKRGGQVKDTLLEEITALRQAVEQLKKENIYLQAKYNELVEQLADSPSHNRSRSCRKPEQSLSSLYDNESVSKSVVSTLKQMMKEKEQLLTNQMAEITVLKAQMQSITTRIDQLANDSPNNYSTNEVRLEDLDDEERLRFLDTIIQSASKTLKKQYDKHYDT